MDTVLAREKRELGKSILQMELEVSSFKFWRSVALINTPFYVVFVLARS